MNLNKHEGAKMLVLVGEDYSVERLKTLKDAVNACADYYTKDGKKVTMKDIKGIDAHGYLNVYEYDSDDLEAAKEDGYVMGVDWKFKIRHI
jgi:hypothetical protein